MKRVSPSSFLLAALVATSTLGAGVSCSGEYFGDVRQDRRLTVELVAPSNPGTRDAPLALQVGTPVVFRVKVHALTKTGAPDTSYTGYVRVSTKPGAIPPLGQNDTEGRNVLLTNGDSPEIDVPVTNAYGTTYVLAEDLGYIPADPFRDPPPACSNGKDDDGDGKIDYPADEGCAFANDDAEQGSSYAAGVSPPIFFALPRVADVRGLTCESFGGQLGCSSTGATPYKKEQIQIDTGFDDTLAPRGNTRVVVTTIASNGFYVQDITDTRPGSATVPNAGFNGLFAFNFNAPPRMRVCDRITSLRGTADEFFGFTQLSYPTWTLTEWNPKVSRCEVPDPTSLSPGTVGDKTALLRLSGSLVRAETTPSRSTVLKVTPKFGPRKVPETAAGVFAPSVEETNCDLNDDGKIDFSPGSKEGICSNTCTADAECTEYSNYAQRGTFRLTITDSGNAQGAIQADASQSASFDPFAARGQELRAFSGILTYFSGGSQFTIQARCKDDIIDDPKSVPFGTDTRTDLNQPPPPLACVRPRTEAELNPQ